MAVERPGSPPRIKYGAPPVAGRHRFLAHPIIPLPHRWAGIARLAIALLVVRPVAGTAQSPWLPQLQLDNDAYNFWVHPGDRPDEEYTNGVKVSLISWSAPWWGKHFAPRTPDCGARGPAQPRCRLTTLTLGQDIYTPRLDRAPFTTGWQDERPYFGWLYLAGTAQIAGARSRRSTTLSVGVSGPPSLGHAMQSLFHTISRRYTQHANGWDTQVGFEPAIALEHRRDLLVTRLGPPSAGIFDLAASGGLTAGTLRTAGDVGATARLGVNMAHPWQPRPWEPGKAWEVFAVAGARAQYVARDMSLDGTLINRDRHVRRQPRVGQYEFGFGARVHHLRVEYRAVTRTREYSTGPGHHTFSTMTASITHWR